MDKTVLTQPFAAELLRSRPGKQGKTVSYVETRAVIERLNQGCEAWDFHVDRFEVLESEVVVLGRLVADGVTKTAFGGSSITFDHEGVQTSIADDLKAASSDALKKCASLLGVGLELYGSPARKVAPPSAAQSQRQSVRPAPVRSGAPTGRSAPHAAVSRRVASSPSSPTAGAEPDATSELQAQQERATVKQLAAIHTASRRQGLGRDSLSALVEGRTGKSELSLLTRHEASSLLSELQGSSGQPH